MGNLPEDRIEPTGRKPLGVKAYGSIGHIPSSRLGPKDYSLHDKQAIICTDRNWRSRSGRPKTVFVQTKLDGSCVAAARLRNRHGGEIIALTRSGLLARHSAFGLHRMWAAYVDMRQDDFRKILRTGERAVGEWLAMAVSTRYDLRSPAECRQTATESVQARRRPPFVLFDIISSPRADGGGNLRMPLAELRARISHGGGLFLHPHTLEGPMPPREAMGLLDHYGALREPGESHHGEGVMYRVENPDTGSVDFLAKWVREDKTDGRLLDENVWNWSWADLRSEAGRR